ncbi:MAG: glycosyltransferase family 4 protein [Candidatus Rokubacteria bacterium]|nr:glycosyltransferase family 4 protein [Candidatus Rokubacteria bacterium]
MAALNRLVLKALTKFDGGRTRVTVLALNEPSLTPLDPFYVDPARTIWRPFGERLGGFVGAAWREVLVRRWDLIFTDQVGVASVLYPLSRLRLCRYSVSCNGLELSSGLLSWRRRLTLFGAERRLAISPTTRAALHARFPGLLVTVCELALDPKLPLDVAAPGIPLSLLTASGEQRELGSQIVLCVGRLWRDQRHKGQDALIRALPLVRERFPAAELVLAGGGDWIDELRALALAEGIGQHVFLPGFVSDEVRDALYARCAVFAMPSKGEGFGLVYLEAMRWSKPCIGGTLDAARDVIVDGKTGLLLAEPHDPRLLADALCRLLKDPEAAQTMGRAGRSRLEDRYLFSHFENRFLHAVGWTQ